MSKGRVDEIPAWGAIEYHLPILEHCWLITSSAEENDTLQPQAAVYSPKPVQSAWKNSMELVAKYQRTLKTIQPIVIDPENPASVFEKIEFAYREARQAGLATGDIVADFTGGTKIMTTGLVLACVPANRDVEYMRPNRYLPDGRADSSAGAEPKLVDLSFILRLTR